MELDSFDEYIVDLDTQILPINLRDLINNKDKDSIITYLKEEANQIYEYNINNNTEHINLIYQIYNFDQKLKLAYNYYLQKKRVCPLKIPWPTNETINNNTLSFLTQIKFYRYMILHWYEYNYKTWHYFDDNNQPYDISNFRYLVNIVTVLLQNQKLKNQMKCISYNYNQKLKNQIKCKSYNYNQKLKKQNEMYFI